MVPPTAPQTPDWGRLRHRPLCSPLRVYLLLLPLARDTAEVVSSRTENLTLPDASLGGFQVGKEAVATT